MALKLLLTICVLTMHTTEFAAASSGTLFHYGLKDQDFPKNGSDSDKHKAFGYYVSGFDYEDRPVVIMDWGKWDLAWLVSHPDLSDKLMRNYENYIEELVSGNFTRKLSNFLPNGYNSDQIVIIKDYDGLDVRQVYTSASIKFAMELLTKMRRCFHSVAYGFMVNSNPLTYQLIEMAKPFAGDFLAKIDVYGTNPKKWIPMLQRKIPRDQLPRSMGGKEDFKPLLEYNFID